MDYSKFLLHLDHFLKPQPQIDYSKLSEEELIAELRKSSEFDKMVFPDSWYSKYDLPMKTCMNTKEFIRESPWMKRNNHWYIEKVELPAKPGGNRPVLPAPEVPVITVVQNSFSDAPKDQTVSEDQPNSQKS